MWEAGLIEMPEYPTDDPAGLALSQAAPMPRDFQPIAPTAPPSGPSLDAAIAQAEQAYYTNPSSRNLSTLQGLYDIRDQQQPTGAAGAGPTWYQQQMVDLEKIGMLTNSLQQEWENKMEVEDLNVNDAIAGFNRALDKALLDMRREEEGGRRGEAIMKTLEQRAGRITPTRDFPGFGSGGSVETALGKYGLPPIRIPGTPVSQLQDPFETYRQATGTVPAPAPMPQVPQRNVAPPPEAQFPGLMEALRARLGGTV
jgi:hypothetical protein